MTAFYSICVVFADLLLFVPISFAMRRPIHPELSKVKFEVPTDIARDTAVDYIIPGQSVRQPGEIPVDPFEIFRRNITQYRNLFKNTWGNGLSVWIDNTLKTKAGLTTIKVYPPPTNSGQKGRIQVLDFSKHSRIPYPTNHPSQEYELNNKYDKPFQIYKGDIGASDLFWLIHESIQPGTNWTHSGKTWIEYGSFLARLRKDELLSMGWAYTPNPTLAKWKQLQEELRTGLVYDSWAILRSMPPENTNVSAAIQMAIQKALEKTPGQKHLASDVRNAFLALNEWHVQNPPWQAFTEEALQHMLGGNYSLPRICVDRHGSYLIDHHRIRGAAKVRAPIEVDSFRASNCMGLGIA